MSKYSKYYEAREKIVRIVSEDLLGPVTNDEVLNETPTSYYIMGKLYPKTDKENEPDDNTTSADLDVIDADSSLASANMKDPRAMGITYTVKKDVNEVSIIINYAFYKPFSIKEANDNHINISRYNSLIEAASDKEKERMVFWERQAFQRNVIIPTDKNSITEIESGVYLKSFFHFLSETGERIITSVLTNERYISDGDRNKVAANTVMQPEIIITGSQGQTDVFTEVKRQVALSDNEELIQLDMLYASDKCFAQGHGCSVLWDKGNIGIDRIRTVFIPSYNLHQMKAAEIKGLKVFNMYYLFKAEQNDVIAGLRQFLELYSKWIIETQSEANADKYAKYRDTADNNIRDCKKMLFRIEHSIDLIAKPNSKEWTAFRYANEAMFLQRCRTIEKQNILNGVATDIDNDSINWYPFQLAFILLEIASFVEPDGDDRRLVDLLWFPTGGGKTEAYLGIAAFSIFYRRISHPDTCNGLTVIMRYTLRLLTIQQFERASMLICACELLRNKYDVPGDEISIGLWVGNNFTPGTIEDADTVLTKIKAVGDIGNDDTNPCQLKVCPWCGNRLYPKNYKVNKAKYRMEIRCTNAVCDYHDVPLPVRLIDEEIYEYRPSFLVATVDKFAQIAIQGKTSALFSVDNDDLAPELIIQDELHLISGPLGTMTGIYEAAITHICESKGRPVKVIASTATIRNASNQIRALYGRDYNQFPPQGINADDSFFAIEATEDEKPTRLYTGIMGVGTTFTTTLIRLYAAWLFASRYLVDLGYDDNVIDNYWTLTGYFNSIRELGATQTQIVDDIQSRYKYLKENKFKDKYADFSGEDKYENLVELTGRMSNDRISSVIQEDLKKTYIKDNHSEVFDFVLASNMISVGVDVGRLGTMAVAGQSKTNAEYIQATSRVGRNNPGLVFTVYNANRSRDRSHYEQFSKYHSALYRYVEATSLTPFSDRARDRGLQALFVTLCRYCCPELLPDDAAHNFRDDLPGVKRAEEIIYRYVNTVDEREKDKVLNEIKDIEKKWQDKAETGELWYRKDGKPSLFRPDTTEDRFRIMNSMRSVEAESGVYLIGESE